MLFVYTVYGSESSMCGCGEESRNGIHRLFRRDNVCLRKKKDIIAVLIGSLISNIFANNINAISDSFILPIISVFLKIDLSKSIKINGIKFNTKKITSSFINLVVSVIFITIVFSKFEKNNIA